MLIHRVKSHLLVAYSCLLHRRTFATCLQRKKLFPQKFLHFQYKFNENLILLIQTRCQLILDSVDYCKNVYPTNVYGLSSVRNLSTNNSSSPRKLDQIDLTFRNTEQAYKSKTSFELFRAIVVLWVSQFDFIVYNHVKVSSLNLCFYF